MKQKYKTREGVKDSPNLSTKLYLSDLQRLKSFCVLSMKLPRHRFSSEKCVVAVLNVTEQLKCLPLSAFSGPNRSKTVTGCI